VVPHGDTRIFLEIEVRRVRCRSCGKVKRERLDFLADNPLYTKRFAHYVGQRSQSSFSSCCITTIMRADLGLIQSLLEKHINVVEIKPDRDKHHGHAAFRHRCVHS
jgi:hypothetical protein